ncbi:hypothetical protein [Pseudomonas mangrovi]
MMRFMLQFCACFCLGLVVAVLILIGLMFAGQMDLVQGLVFSGKPVAGVALELLPDGLWTWLTGVEGAAEHPSVTSFLQLCVALAQVALLLALGFFRLWYRT